MKMKRLPHALMLALGLSCMYTSAVAANFTVTSNTDNSTGGTVGTLSWAITQANLSSGNTITIDGTVSSITVTGTLPALTQLVTILTSGNVTLTNGTLTSSGSGAWTVNAGSTLTGTTGSAGVHVGWGTYSPSAGQGGSIAGVATLTNNGTINGGTGGYGGNGGFYALGDPGGTGGVGGSAISGSGFNVTNTGILTGGNGGAGGNGGGGTISGGNGGTGGMGGTAVSGSGYTLSNSGTVTGGNGALGGAGGAAPASGSTGGFGLGGVAVVSTGGATITNTGTISGGLANAGAGARADAINLSGGSNTLILGAGSTINGNVVSNSVPTGDMVRVNAGTATINGNMTLPANGTFRTDVTNDTTYGKLVVSGTVTLAANAKIDVNVANPSFFFTSARSSGLANIISAGTLNASTFVVTDNSTLFNFNAVLDGNTVDLTLAAASNTGVLNAVNNTGNTPAIGAARVLDQIITGDPGGSIGSLFVSLTTDQAVSNAASQTLPLMTGSTGVAMSNVLHGTNRIIQSRQEGQHGRSSGDKFYGDEHVWFKPFGSWANHDDRKGVSGFDANTYGMVFGVDGEFGDANRIGAAFAYARSNIDSNSSVAPQRADVDTYQLALYGSHSLSDATDLNFQADIGRHNTEGRRNILFAGTTARSDYDTWSAHIGGGIAHTMSLSDKTSFTPSVRADYTWMKDDSYVESGAGALNLDVNSNHTQELIFSADGRLAHVLTDKVTVTANLGAGYDVINERASITSAFAGAPSAAFVTNGLDSSPWMARGGLGLVTKANETVEISARYDFEVRQDFDNQTASVKVRWAF